MIYKETIFCSGDIKKYLKNSKQPIVLLNEDETIVNTAKFSNGYTMDIKCCGVQFEPNIDNSAWTEAVLFNENGQEVACTDVEDEYFGYWTIEYNGDVYTVVVEEEKESINIKFTEDELDELKVLLRLTNGYLAALIEIYDENARHTSACAYYREMKEESNNLYNKIEKLTGED